MKKEANYIFHFGLLLKLDTIIEVHAHRARHLVDLLAQGPVRRAGDLEGLLDAREALHHLREALLLGRPLALLALEALLLGRQLALLAALDIAHLPDEAVQRFLKTADP